MTRQGEAATGTDPGSKSAAEIEREVRQSRADVEHVLDAIQERLSPGQLLDQAVGYFRGGGGEFVRNFGDTVTRNPIPVTLLGVGLAWMMLSDRSARRDDEDRFEPTYRDDLEYDEVRYRESVYGGEAVHGDPQALSGLGSESEETGPGLGERVSGLGERAAGFGDRVKETGSTASEKAGELGAEARQRAADARAGLANRAEGARIRARRYGRRAREGAFQALSEQPLVLGALGLAVGAAIGAALPPSEAEDKVMGEAGDELQRRAGEAGREQLAKARAAAGAAYGAARDEAEEQGLTPEAARETTRATADKLGKVAGAARSAAEEKVESRPSGDRPASI